MFTEIIILSFAVSFISLLTLRPLALKLKLLDYPDNRKNHIGEIPLIGGISIFLGLIACYINLNEFDKVANIILMTSFLILVLGIFDDLYNLNPKSKLLCQFVFVILTIYFSNLKIQSLDNFFIFYSLELSYLSVPLTLIAVIGLTNAFNMIDGIDGLAGSLAIVAISGIIFFNLSSNISIFTSILLSIFSGLIPFFIFNFGLFKKKKIFLGDGGSLVLGFIISWGLIYNAENVNEFTSNFALWCVAIPLFDLFGVVIIRRIENRSIIIADNDHIHHFFKKIGFSENIVLVIIICFAFIMLFIGMFLDKFFPLLSLPAFLILFLFYLAARLYYKNKKFYE